MRGIINGTPTNWKRWENKNNDNNNNNLIITISQNLSSKLHVHKEILRIKPAIEIREKGYDLHEEVRFRVFLSNCKFSRAAEARITSSGNSSPSYLR